MTVGSGTFGTSVSSSCMHRTVLLKQTHFEGQGNDE